MRVNDVEIGLLWEFTPTYGDLATVVVLAAFARIRIEVTLHVRTRARSGIDIDPVERALLGKT